MNTIPIHVSLDENDNKIQVIFDHLPRPGDFIMRDDSTYLVDRVIFDVVDSNKGLAAVPNIFCKPAR